MDNTVMIDVEHYSTVEELKEVGPDKLKAALAALGLKSAERVFLTKQTPLEKLDTKHLAKGSYERNNVLLMEAKVTKVCELLKETIIRTKENVERKQEMETEREEEEEELELQVENDDDEEQKIYMGNLFRIGYLNLTGLVRNSSVRYVEAIVITAVENMNGISRNGGINMGFNEITSIEEAKGLWERIRERQGLNILRKSMKMKKGMCITKRCTQICNGRVCFREVSANVA